MIDHRRFAARAAYDAVEHPYHLFEHIYAVCDAMLAYDVAHPQPEPRKEVVPHEPEPVPDHKSAAPLVGADPPPAYRVELASDGCPECRHGTYWCIVGPDGVALGTDYFDKGEAEELAEMLTDAWHAGRAGAVAHLTDDAVVEAAIKNWFYAFHESDLTTYRGSMSAALAAAGRALMGETDG